MSYVNNHSDVQAAKAWLERNLKPGCDYHYSDLVKRSGCQMWALLEAWAQIRRPAGTTVAWGHEVQAGANRGTSKGLRGRPRNYE